MQKTEWRWKPMEIARIPTVQLIAMFAQVNETHTLEIVNRVRAKKGFPPLARLYGKG